jgi:urease accessory protein
MLLAPLAMAHPGHDNGTGLSAGFLHPLTGLDHLLAMLSVGILAGQRGGRAVFTVPASFIGAMLFGAYLGLHSVHMLAAVEQGIIASVLVLGVCVAMATSAPYSAVLILPALFATFHGYAHMTEIRVGHSAFAYGVGFTAATALLLAAGVATGMLFRRFANLKLGRFAGAAIATCGILLFAHVL